MNVQFLLFAKEPVPGAVKTRLCPPCTPEQAAAVAAVAVEETIAVLQAVPALRRTLVVSGRYLPPPGWGLVAQRGDGLAERLRYAFADTVIVGVPSLLVGMDTPQVTPQLLGEVAAGLERADAVLGPAEDGGWWALALREPRHAVALTGVPMSTPDTGALTVAALRGRGLAVALAPTLRDVDTAADAWAVANAQPSGRFAAAVRTHVPAPQGVHR